MADKMKMFLLNLQRKENDYEFFKLMKEYHISFNPENVILLTKTCIPPYVTLIASLGWKYNFINNSDDTFPWEDLRISFEKILQETNEYGQNISAKREMQEMLTSNFNIKPRKKLSAQNFLYDQFLKASNFLKLNKDVLVLPADKGGKSIIIDRILYFEKMDMYMEESVREGTYQICNNLSMSCIRTTIENKYDSIRQRLNTFFKIDKEAKLANLCSPLISEPFIIARIYGTIKIHKDDLPIRPIISSPECIGKELSDWVLKKLETIAVQFDEVKIKSSYELFISIADVQLPPGYKLSTWDFSSMFTNIPFDIAKSIIREFYLLIERETTVPVDLFIEVLDFLVNDIAFFTYRDRIYKQIRGLAMGNCLSQILAEIVTSFAMLNAKRQIGENEFSFLVKFVDDICGAMKVEAAKKFEELMNNIVEGLSVKREDEDESGSVTYLNCRIIRRTDNTIGFSWWQKPYSSQQILNFHSNHPVYMKRNVVEEYISNAIKITTDDNVFKTVMNLKKILKRSNYPQNFYLKFIQRTLISLGRLHNYDSVDHPDPIELKEELLLKQYGEGEYRKFRKICMTNPSNHRKRKTKKIEVKIKTKRNFISTPYNENIFQKTQKIIRKHHINVKLAPKPALQNGLFFFSNVKNKKKNSNIKNSMFSVNCTNCSFRKWIRTSNLDVERTLMFEFNRSDSTIMEHMQSNNGHIIPFSVSELKKFKNSFDLTIAFNDKMKKEN